MPDAVKPTNPKDALSYKKVPFSVVPMTVVAGIALGLLEGALKYSRHNYRVAGVRASVYFDATVRHLASFWEGEDIDPDSKVGLHHIDKALASLTVLRDAMINNKWTDDRPPSAPENWINSANETAIRLIAAFPNPLPPCTQTMVEEARASGTEPVVPAAGLTS